MKIECPECEHTLDHGPAYLLDAGEYECPECGYEFVFEPEEGDNFTPAQRYDWKTYGRC